MTSRSRTAAGLVWTWGGWQTKRAAEIDSRRLVVVGQVRSLAFLGGITCCAAGRGQVHVFGLRFVDKMRFLAEKWTSPRLARERLLTHEHIHESSVGFGIAATNVVRDAG